MLTEFVTLLGSLKATGAITSKRFVTRGGAQAGAGVTVAGVAGDDAAIGEMVPVKGRGWLVVEAGAAVAVDADLQSDANGRAITLAGGVSVGRALDAATAAGQFIRVDR